MKRKYRRLWLVGLCLTGLGSAVGLSLLAFRQNVIFFVTPSGLVQQGTPGQVFRLGGLVQSGTLKRADQDGSSVAQFQVTDGVKTVEVTYRGILPDLFREGQGVVALGSLQPDHSFRAQEVLAKHDETYMPKDVADALKKRGYWKPKAAGS